MKTPTPTPTHPTAPGYTDLAAEFYRICKGYYHDQAVELMAAKLAERDALAPEMAEALAALVFEASHAIHDPNRGTSILANELKNARIILSRISENFQ